MPTIVAIVGLAWASLLLVGGGLLLLRASDNLHRLLALDVLSTIVVIMLTTIAYVTRTSYTIDAGLALALLSFFATLVVARYLGRRPPF